MAKKKTGTLKLKNQRRCDTCGDPLVYNGKGRPPRFCSTCKSITETQPSTIKPIGVPATPLDVPQETILKKGAPKLIELDAAPDPWGSVSAMAATFNYEDELENVERRIGLISRYIIEASLWDAVGMSKKERFDAALGSIKTLEGSKANIKTQDVGAGKNVPHTQKQLDEEKSAVSSRLRRLIKEKDRIDDPQIKIAADQLVQLEKGDLPRGEA